MDQIITYQLQLNKMNIFDIFKNKEVDNSDNYSTFSNQRRNEDTPEVKTGAGRKSRLRKDRYSALIMANMSARNFKIKEELEIVSGGFAGQNSSRFDSGGKMFNGPSWFSEKIQDVY